MDFTKTRLQLQNELRASSSKESIGFLAMMVHVYKFEGGVAAFYAGAPAAMLRQATYGGLSFFLYPYTRDALAASTGNTEANLIHKLTAGGLAGGVAAAIANPTDGKCSALQPFVFANCVQKWSRYGYRQMGGLHFLESKQDIVVL
jgi:hypothetical protein